MESKKNIENKRLIYDGEDSFFRCEICGLMSLIGIDYQNKKIYIEKKCENNHISKTEINTYLKLLNSFEFKCFNCNKQKYDLYFWPQINKFYCNSCKPNNPEKSINIKKFDSICQKSLIDYSCYCLKCEKNQCIYCICKHEKEKKFFNSCIINFNEIQFFKNNLSKAKELLKRIEKNSLKLFKHIHEDFKLFEKNINEFKEKNDTLIRLCEKIIKCYENHVSNKNINYQVIQNVRNVLNFKLNLKSSNSIHEHFEIIKNFLILENSKLNIEIRFDNESKLNNLHFEKKNFKINNNSQNKIYLSNFINNNEISENNYNSRIFRNSNLQSPYSNISNSIELNNHVKNKFHETISPLIFNFFENKKIDDSNQEKKQLNNENIEEKIPIFKLYKNKHNFIKKYDKNLKIENYILSYSTSNEKNNIYENCLQINKKIDNQKNVNLNNISCLEELDNENKNNSKINETIEKEIKRLNLMKEMEKEKLSLEQIQKELEIENHNANINYIIDKEIKKIKLIKEKEQLENIISEHQLETEKNNLEIKETIEKEIEKLNKIKGREKEENKLIEIKNEQQNEKNIKNNNDSTLNLIKEKSLETISFSSESELLESKVKIVQLKKVTINSKSIKPPNKEKENIFKISKVNNKEDLLLKEIFKKYPRINEKDKNISIVHNYLYDDNSFYSGEMNVLTKEREGRGILIDPDGSYRIGYFHHNNQEKNGIWHYVDEGFYYEGEFNNNLQQGYGECYWDNEDYFSGLFHKSNLINGDYHFNNGTIYRGSFKNGKKNGFGKIYNPLKNIWEEKEFKNDIIVGDKKKGK